MSNHHLDHDRYQDMIFTDHVHSMRESNVLTGVCDSVQGDGGGGGMSCPGPAGGGGGEISSVLVLPWQKVGTSCPGPV